MRSAIGSSAPLKAEPKGKIYSDFERKFIYDIQKKISNRADGSGIVRFLCSGSAERSRYGGNIKYNLRRL